MNPTPGWFIVFEGLDGSGSSTQARLLKEALSREWPKVYLTSEPSPGPIGQLIRLAMSHRVVFSDDEASDDRQLAYLFAADRYDHLHNKVDGVLKQLAAGAIVISTRYYLSSFAYHCRSEEDFDRVAKLNEEFPPAGLTFYIDCPVETCLQRIEQRQYASEKYEHRAKLTAVRDNFSRALAAYGHELHQLDGQLPAADLHQQVLGIVRKKLGARHP